MSERPPSVDHASAETDVRRRYLVIALASFAVLFYEVLLTRITSAVLLYHFTFLSLSLAMLGLGAPGIWYAFWPPGPRALGRSLLLAGVTIPLSIAVIFHVGALWPATGGGLPGLSLLVVGAGLTPLLALGSVICILLMEASETGVGRVYAADLVGASLGAVLVIPAMGVLDAPRLMALAGLAPLAAAVILGARYRPHALVVGALLVAAVVWQRPFELHFNRVYTETSDLLYERWTATGRVTIHRPKGAKGKALSVHGWGWGRKHQPVKHEEMWIHQEGGAGTPITRLSGPVDELRFLLDDVTSVAYQLVEPKRVAVVGAGGGRDVLTALLAGAEHVDAVELNPAILGAVTGPFREFAGDIYRLPGVRPVVSEGRSFLTRARGGYGVVQISMVDSWAATAAGAYALSENYLYTEEAIRLYLDRLADDGAVSIVRWFAPDDQVHTTRLALLAAHALSDAGVENPRDHVAVVQSRRAAVVMIFKQPLGQARAQKLARINAERGFHQLAPPNATTPAASIVGKALETRPWPSRIDGRDVTPSTDDRPFFFQTVPLLGSGDQTDFNEQSVVLLRWLLTAMGALSLALFFLPFALRRGGAPRSHLWRGTAYFAAIGAGFMLVETPVIHQVVLLLGHPSYATTVVLSVVLVSAGAGSYVVSRTSLPTLVRRFIAVPVVLLACAVVLPWLTRVALTESFGIRVLGTAALLAPMGFALGIGFPAGMRRYGDEGRAWLWAVNGATSVMGSIVGLTLAMGLGFSAVNTIGVGCYLVAYSLLRHGEPS